MKLTEEEAKKFSEENKLNAEELEAVNGGYIHFNNNLNRYEIIDDKTGQVLEGGWYVGPENCGETAKKRYGMSDKEISDNELAELRKRYSLWHL